MPSSEYILLTAKGVHILMNEDITGAVRMLPEYCSKVIHDYTSSLSYLEEVRMRANKPLEVFREEGIAVKD